MNHARGLCLGAATWCLTGALCFAAAAPGTGEGPVPRLSLRDCLEIAREKHPAIRADREAVRAQRAESGRTRAPYYPSLDVAASASRSEASNASLDTRTRTETWTPASLSGAQRIYDFGRTGGASGSAARETAAAEADLQARAEAVELEVKLAYFGALRAERTLAVAEETLRQRQELLRITRKRFEAGERPRYDVTRAEIDAESARLGLISASARLELARRSLLARMGAPAQAWRPIADDLEAAPGRDFDEEKLISAALAGRAEIRAQRERVASSERLVESARGEFYPALDAFGSYDWSGQRADGVFLGRSRTWEFGLRAKLNLFGGLATLEGLRRREALLSKARQDLDSLEQNVRLELQEALISARESRERIAGARRLLESAGENLDLWTKAYHAGKGNIIYVTDAQGQLLSAKVGLIGGLADYRADLARLERAAGLALDDLPR